MSQRKSVTVQGAGARKFTDLPEAAPVALWARCAIAGSETEGTYALLRRFFTETTSNGGA